MLVKAMHCTGTSTYAHAADNTGRQPALNERYLLYNATMLAYGAAVPEPAHLLVNEGLGLL
jgi:hypothetical protein